MAEIVTLQEAIATLVGDGDSVALEGFTHLIPFAAGHEVLRQGKVVSLTLIPEPTKDDSGQIVGNFTSPGNLMVQVPEFNSFASTV